MTEQEARQEAEKQAAWRSYMAEHGYSTVPTSPDTGADFSAGFERGWQASRVVVAAPSDTAEDIVKAVRLWAKRFIPGDRWDPEDMHDLEAALSCVVEAAPTAHDRRRVAAPSDTDPEALEQATLYGYQAVWDDGKFEAVPTKNAWMWGRVQIAVKAAVERAARPSPPVQVEVTEIRNAVQKVLWNASNYPEKVSLHMLGRDITPLRDKVTDAVVAALGGGDHE